VRIPKEKSVQNKVGKEWTKIQDELLLKDGEE
jgi:hypothetical protein